MARGIWFCNLLFLSYVVQGYSIYLPFSNCYPDKEQDCGFQVTDEDASLSKIRFLLFTRRNPTDPELLHLCNGRLPKNSNYNPGKKLLVFLPGFLFGTCQMSIMDDIKDAWLKRDDYNVIVLENAVFYGLNYYYSATSRSWAVANRTAEVLRNIQEDVGLLKENIHLIGMSLGAQTAGQIGRLFKVHRITGLDPPQVMFSEKNPEDTRLDRNDADLVDVIHCNSRTGFLDFGITYPAGHADFYPNGGHEQPNCTSTVLQALKSYDLTMIGTLGMPSMCYHAQCLYYYYLSINNEYGNFTAWSCDSYQKYRRGECHGKGAKPVVMGFDFEETFTREQRKKPLPRKYYLDTLGKWPYVKKGGTPNKVSKV